MNRRQFLGATVLLAACRKTRVPYLAFGDSITGHKPGVTSYAEMMGAKVHALPGKTTEQALRVLWEDTLWSKYQLATVMFGTNDHAIPDGHSSPLVSLKDYERNLTLMTDSLLSCSRRVALLTPPFIATTKTTSESRLRTYVDVMKSVAAKEKVTLIDVHQLTGDMCRWSDTLWLPMTVNSDGVHPTTEVHAAIRSLLVRTL